MSKLVLLRDFYDYNAWANDRLLGTAAGVPAAQLSDVIGTMGHIVAAQINWLERWQGGVNKRSTVALQETFRTLTDLRAAANTSHADLRAYLGQLADAKLEQPLTFRDSSGAQQTRILWHLLTHVANHGTHHRGEAALMLTTLGHSPGDLDFGYWVDARGG